MTQTTTLLDQETEQLTRWAKHIELNGDGSFEKARKMAKRLGAHYNDGKTTIGFWTPELKEVDDVYLEVFHPQEDVRFKVDEQQLNFKCEKVPIARQGDYCLGVYKGISAGDKTSFGSFYQLWYHDNNGVAQTISDPLAYSLPFGAFAPAELYDIEKAQANRKDVSYFAGLSKQQPEEETPRITPATNMLEVHVGTASSRGTFKGLTEIYRQIAAKIRDNQPLTPKEQVFSGYDGIQLMPIEPVIENPNEKPFWNIVNRVDEQSSDLSIIVRHPNMINWGYDILIFGSCAINATMLETGRPDEFIEFLEVMHNFPEKPIKVTIDIVFGHSDDQGKKLLNRYFFKGDNMYGQDIDYRHPVVRALLLEMQERKMNWGIDAIRIDGAQDFKHYDSENEELVHDDDFLTSMSYVEQNVGGHHYYPWMIFEDGRPWPREDWELASTYRHLIDQQDFAYQWGPLIFAHNTPFLYTYWATKWWRVEEMAHRGERWISGYANHDTLRRGIQASPIEERINTGLGRNFKEIINTAYDNPATTLLCYGFLPGVPMDFLNASFHTPWSFMRNTDTYWALKVVAEEHNFLHWQFSDLEFEKPKNFRRLKSFGFTKLDDLKTFLDITAHAIEITDYEVPAIALLLNQHYQGEPDVEFTEFNLAEFAQHWMRDVYELSNVSRYEFTLDHNQTTYNHKTRMVRHQRPWLQQNLSDDDYFNYLKPADGSIIYYGMRTSPDKSEQLLFLANMEGEPVELTPVELPIPNLPQDRWKKVVAAPKTPLQSALNPVELTQTKAILFSREIRE